MKLHRNLHFSKVIYLIFAIFIFGLSSAGAQDTPPKLPNRIEDGVMLHAYMWPLKVIQENLKNIADSGYNAIQVSPIQATKQTSGQWWLLYQPCNLDIGNALLGTYADFHSLCEIAENTYDIKIIVDVVLNQVADNGKDGQWADQLAPELKKSEYFHNLGTIQNYSDRQQVTQNNLGNGPDWNTQREDVQDMHLAFLNKCIDAGADGFRFDAAKHIETNLGDDRDKSWAGGYWHRILNRLQNRDNLYLFGEVILDNGDNRAIYWGYYDITAHNYGRDLVYAVGSGNIADAIRSSISHIKGVPVLKAMTYVENHDNFEHNETRSFGYRDRKLAHALIVARAGLTPRLYDRPIEDMWNDPDVIALNWFRNNMTGQGEYLRFPSNDTVAIERGQKGMVIVNVGNQKQIDMETGLIQGKYNNHATADCTMTVTNGRIKGEIPARSIIVLYTPETTNTPVKTKFKARFDVGFGNSLNIRGNVTPLIWNKGIQMTWTNGNVWVWETEKIQQGADVEFKVLRNDQDWEKGMNHRVKGGDTVEITPAF